MKRQTNIIQTKKQTRATIPKEYVDKLKVTKKDKMEWDEKNGKLKGVLKKHE